MNVEVHELPIQQKPYKANACRSEEQVVQLCPNPPTGSAQASQCVQNHEECAERAEHANKPENDNPAGKGVDRRYFVGHGEHHKPADEQAEEEYANKPSNEHQSAFRRRHLKRTPVMFADHCAHWPKQYSQSDDDQAADQNEIIEIF